MKGNILRAQGRAEEAVAEHERALALDPSNTDAAGAWVSTTTPRGIRQKR